MFISQPYLSHNRSISRCSPKYYKPQHGLSICQRTAQALVFSRDIWNPNPVRKRSRAVTPRSPLPQQWEKAAAAALLAPQQSTERKAPSIKPFCFTPHADLEANIFPTTSPNWKRFANLKPSHNIVSGGVGSKNAAWARVDLAATEAAADNSAGKR